MGLFPNFTKNDPPNEYFRTCKHRERHQCDSKVFQYCGILKSNRTDNGKLKIKCKREACVHYERNY